jgi:uncharacterized protein
VTESLKVGGLSWVWHDEPERWSTGPADRLTVEVGPATRWFVDPGEPSDRGLRAPALLAAIGGEYQLRASVELHGTAAFDAGALVVHAHERAWAKLCVENSPSGVPTVVSVVTRGVSDDCNSFALTPGRSDIALRVSRLGAAYAFHASLDGESWDLIRYFSLDAPEPVSVGFQAQSPRGTGAMVRFSDIALIRERLRNLRSGE